MYYKYANNIIMYCYMLYCGMQTQLYLITTVTYCTTNTYKYDYCCQHTPYMWSGVYLKQLKLGEMKTWKNNIDVI